MRRPFPALLLWFAACGGPSDDPDAAPPLADGPPATADAPPPDASMASPFLVGTWREVPSQVDGDIPPDQRPRLVLDASGTWTHTSPDETETGTYTADALALTAHGTDPDGEAYTITIGYVATADDLLLGALFPSGTVDGTVGTWIGDAIFNGVAIQQTMVFNADQTAHYERHEGTDVEMYDGTWAYEVDDVVFTTMIGSTTVHLHLQELRGVAIGGPLHERIPAGARVAGGTGRGGGRVFDLWLEPLSHAVRARR